MLLNQVRSRVAASATSLVDESDRVPTNVAAQPHPRSDLAISEVAETVGPVARRLSRSGAAIGTAVHEVLELVRFADPSDQEVQLLTEAACEGQNIPALVTDVAARVRHALTVQTISDAAATGRFWREVYVVSRDSERYVEGYIDLLVESQGGLIVVDYKTDRADSEVERFAKVNHYRPQLKAYAEAVDRVPELTVAAGELLFLSPEAATPERLDLG